MVESHAVVDGCGVVGCFEVLIFVKINDFAVDGFSSQTLLDGLVVHFTSDQQTHIRVLRLRILISLFLYFDLVDREASIRLGALARMKARDSGHQQFSQLFLLLRQIFGYVVFFEFVSHILMYFSARHSFYRCAVDFLGNYHFVSIGPVIRSPRSSWLDFDSCNEHALYIGSGVVDSFE